MIYAKVSEEGRQLLEKELKHAQEAKWYRRLKIVHLSAQGHPVPHLAQAFDLSPVTVRDYLKRYNQGGVEALRPGASPGRPPKLPLTRQDGEDLLYRSPCQFAQLQTAARNWTQEWLRAYCSVYLGVEVAQSTLCMLLKRLGLRWNRGKLKVTSPDPLYTVKRERVERLKKRPGRAS